MCKSVIYNLDSVGFGRVWNPSKYSKKLHRSLIVKSNDKPRMRRRWQPWRIFEILVGKLPSHQSAGPQGRSGNCDVKFTIINGWCYTHSFPDLPWDMKAEERFTVALSKLSSMACLQKYTPRKNRNRKNSTVRNGKFNITYRRGQNFAACRGEALIFSFINFHWNHNACISGKNTLPITPWQIWDRIWNHVTISECRANF